MEQTESHIEIGKKLLETLHSLVVHFPENAQSNIDKLKKMLESLTQSQLLISVLLGFGLLFQVFLKYVRQLDVSLC